MLTPTVVEISSWDRQELELAFRDSENRLKEVVENAPIPIVLQDRQFRYVLANQHLRAMFWDGRDLVGKTPYDAWPPDAADRFVQHLREVLESGVPVESEDTVPRPDGPHTVLIQRFPLRDVRGEISAIAVMGMDITSQKRAEAAAKAATAHAERANRAKSDVLASMSHGLRSPLNAIVGYSELLQTEQLSPAASDSLAGITDAAGRLLELVEEVLEIAHLEAGTKALAVGPVRACEALREALQLARPLAQERGIELAPDMRGGMDEFVAADPSALRRAMTNILTNAIDYSPDGGRVTASFARRDQDLLRLLIADMGPGIPEADRERIFLPFERTDAPSGDVKMGIGLALSKGLVESMGGSIGIERTATGAGSVFFVDLPLSDRPARAH